MQKLNLRELKGAPLSIILAIVMAGNRNVSVSYLVTETGYSDKTVNSGLDMLRSRQIVTQTGRCRYQLTGENIQLPLYWGETTEPADPSPASDQPALFELGTGAEKFSGKISKTGKIPELEYRIARLEKRVSDIENRKNSEEKPEKIRNLIEIPAETGEIPDDDNKSSSIINTNINNQDTDDEKGASGKIPEMTEEELDELYDKNGEIANEYLRESKYNGTTPMSIDEIKELIRMEPSPEIFEFVLPRAKDFEAAKKWLSYKDVRTLKYELCRFFGIYETLQKEFSDRKDISIYAIDWHYWNWQLNELDNPKITLGSVIARISKHFNSRQASSGECLQYKYLD